VTFVSSHKVNFRVCLCLYNIVSGLWGWHNTGCEVCQVLWSGLWSWHPGSNWWSGEGFSPGL